MVRHGASRAPQVKEASAALKEKKDTVGWDRFGCIAGLSMSSHSICAALKGKLPFKEHGLGHGSRILPQIVAP